MKVTVVQIGARHHYAIPRILEQAGLLASLYTDAIAGMGLGKVLPRLPMSRRDEQVRKLSQRIPHGVPRLKIRQTDALLWRRIRAKLRLGAMPEGYIDDDYLFDRITADWGFGGADTLYAMQKHGTKLIEAAKSAGLRVVVDVFITPLAHRIVEEERLRFPDLEPPSIDKTALEREDERNSREFAMADLLLCPGQNVVDGVRSYHAAQSVPVAVVPYGSGISFEGRQNEPKVGRILFAGTADLRKGIHYLGMAADRLKHLGYEFRIAGGVTDRVRNHPQNRHLTFLGRLPRGQMQQEFLHADLFVLPTLAEGCASVVHEAIMAGCPVVTTEASGTVVRHEWGGLLVRERDPVGLADAITRVIGSRKYRALLAESCKEVATELSERAWEQRLVAALGQ